MTWRLLPNTLAALALLFFAISSVTAQAADKPKENAIPPKTFVPTVILRPGEKITFLLSPLPEGRTAIDFEGLPAGVRGEIDGDLANDLHDKYNLDLLCVRLVATTSAKVGESLAKVVAIPFDNKNPPYNSPFKLIIVPLEKQEK